MNCHPGIRFGEYPGSIPPLGWNMKEKQSVKQKQSKILKLLVYYRIIA